MSLYEPDPPPHVPDAEPLDLPLAETYNLDLLPPEPDFFDVPIVMPVEREVPVVRPDDVECWRCGWYDAPEYGRCARCDARLTRPASRRPRSPGTGGPSRLAVVMITYGLIMLVTVIWAVIAVVSSGEFTEEDTQIGLAILEGVDTLLVLMTMLLVGRVTLRNAPTGSWPVAWSLAGPILFALICGNVLFTTCLRELFRAPAVPGPGVSFATVMLICVQPAIVEELFFRHVAFGALRRELGLHSTALITSVMFALAHIGNPLGMPYLFVAGVVFGYARVYGGLPLSMLMHFLHNLAVISIDAAK